MITVLSTLSRISRKMAEGSLTGPLILTVLSVVFGSSFLFGYNIGVINAPQMVMGYWIRQIRCERIGNDTRQTGWLKWCSDLNATQEENMFSENSELNSIWATVTAIFCLGGLFGALSISYFSDRYGRRGTLLINSVVGIVATAILVSSYLVRSYEMLIVGRFVMGLNGGLNSGVPVIYLIEISPRDVRGAIGVVHNIFFNIALCLSQVFGLPYILGNDWGWPILFGLNVIPCVVQLISLPFCPESPKFLFLERDDEIAATQALLRLRKKAEIEEEISEMRLEQINMKNEPIMSIREIMYDPFLRKTTIIVMMLMLMQQFSGINGIAFYSTSIFKSAGLSTMGAIYGTIGVGVVNVVIAFITMGLVEKVGRKMPLLVGFAGLMIVMALLFVFMLLYTGGQQSGGAAVGLVNSRGWAAWASVSCLIVFVMFYNVGPGPIPGLLVCELFRQNARASATSMALLANQLGSLIVALCFPLIQAAIKEYIFLGFSVLLAFFVAYSWFKVPETKGKRLEEIQADIRQAL